MKRTATRFTFQYVSINTVMNGITYERLENFTFQYVSINTVGKGQKWLNTNYFTFQYVSINTHTGSRTPSGIHHLHSNMFLLIRRAQT